MAINEPFVHMPLPISTSCSGFEFEPSRARGNQKVSREQYTSVSGKVVGPPHVYSANGIRRN
jgi:hypothetical protein